MKRNLHELRDYSLSCVDDIEFTWRGIHGLIIPFSPQKYILFFHDPDDLGTEFHDIDEMLNAPYLDGHSLAEVCDEIIFLR